MIKTIQKQIHSAAGQVRQAFLGIVARSDADKLQLKGLSDEVLQSVDLIQQVGFVSGLPTDARVVVLPLSGKTGRAVVIASRGGTVVIEVSVGETCIYDQFGHQILLSENGIKMVGDVVIDGNLTVKNDIESNGQISDVLGSMLDMRLSYNTHKHGNTPPPDQQMD